MAIGERIRFLRGMRGMTQKNLGKMVGFDDKTADIRIAQYESGTRTPKEKLVEGMAYALNVSPRALSVPDIDTYIGLFHTLFTLEDLYGLAINEIDGIDSTAYNTRRHEEATGETYMPDNYIASSV